jgi:hypothetical protein
MEIQFRSGSEFWLEEYDNIFTYPSDGVNDQLQRLDNFRIILWLREESGDDILGFVVAILEYEPTRALRHEEDEGNGAEGEEVLKCKGETPAHVIIRDIREAQIQPVGNHTVHKSCQ